MMKKILLHMILLSVIQVYTCLHLPSAEWTDSEVENLRLAQMVYLPETDTLFVGATNYLYQLEGKDLIYINHVRDGPVVRDEVPIDNDLTVMVLNTTVEDEMYITTCRSEMPHCLMRNVSDLTGTPLSFRPAVNIQGAVALSVVKAENKPPRNRLYDLHYTFYACPHSQKQETDNDESSHMCYKPGLRWPDTGGDFLSSTQINFKQLSETDVVTEKFIYSSAIENFRIFFSIQRNEVTRRKHTKLAQVCQYKQPRDDKSITTTKTYVDMELRCGNHTVMTDVEKLQKSTGDHFVATFTNLEQTSSVVCLYSYQEIKSKLVENIKDCWNGINAEGRNNYIKESRCSQGGRVPVEKDDNYFLCNKDFFPGYFSIIGMRSLDRDPVLTYDHVTLTSLTTSVVGSELVAFLGTNIGVLRKAVIYPPENARKLDWTVMLANMEAINPDMFISKDKEIVYAITSYKVATIPVHTCSDHAGCRECLSSRDPHCGWCVAENRCTTNRSYDVTWIAAANESNSCPTVNIRPSVISVSDGPVDLRVTLTPELPEARAIYCIFYQDNDSQTNSPLLFGNSSVFNNSGDGTEFTCRTPNFTSIRDNIQGSMNVSVAIQTKLSRQPLLYGKLTVYDCMTFQRCSSCLSSMWSCSWCPYENKCSQDSAFCNQQQSNTNQTSLDCPNVLEIEDIPTFLDSGTLYLPVHESINVTVNGRGFLEPRYGLQYSCKIPGATIQPVPASWVNSTQITCHLEKELYHLQSATGRHQSKIEVMWGNSTLDGHDIPVEVYRCEDLAQPVHNQPNCDKCKSYQLRQPYYQCKWCSRQCTYRTFHCEAGSAEETCPGPVVIRVSPLKIHMNSPKVRIDIHGVNLGSTFNETVDVITVGNQTCVSLEEGFQPSERLSCTLEAPGEAGDSYLAISLTDREPFTYSEPIKFKNSSILTLFPAIGPLSGGTLVTLYGADLDIGREHSVKLDDKPCTVVNSNKVDEIVCLTPSSTTKSSRKISLDIDGFSLRAENVSFTYVDDPVVESILPKKSFKGGGRQISVTGTNLNAIQMPKIYIRNIQDGRRSKAKPCERIDDTVIICPSPKYPRSEENNSHPKLRKREANPNKEPWLVGFEMDGVLSVRNLPDNLARMVYVENPRVIPFENPQKYAKVIIIKAAHFPQGERMAVAASLSDVGIRIGEEKCNVTGFTNETISCKPPVDEPAFNQTVTKYPPVEVQIGFIRYDGIGLLDYGPKTKPDHTGPEERSSEYIIAGAVVGALVLIVLALIIVVVVITRKKRRTSREKDQLLHQMENLEASVSRQCREEFAALQTTMSDLTGDLEGGNVLFRDYNVYACKVLLTDTSHPVLAPPIMMNDNFLTGMEPFKGLLKNKDFLLLFIRTLEQQKSFTIQDKSNLASLLMTVHSDNMEFVTDIMKTLLNELIDKTVASQRAKLLLRRSECVVEKLVTHWLSICLYHYLKENTGSALYILYKAIKVQVEKGPLDYITGCAKYTLSEAKLFTAMDAEINAKTLSLQVHHHCYISDTDQGVMVQVLDCDTVTQAKSKMLDVLYKNTPYSQRPNVHRTLLVLKESGGTERALHDEDSSNEKDGIWKRLNTLQHYSVEEGAMVKLSVSAEKDISMLSDNNSPDSFIVGSMKRSKQVMRTISGSNFWHLIKQHKSDEVQLSSDIFLPRLLNTKGTLQTYIDDLFAEMFRVGEEPPVIIKFFFDFLDAAAERHGITDPDVIHTWKCNSLLLRFWVNLVKNPEFVFDIHKPNIVDSCLSVVTQTLMDSCSTAALTLGKDSPSNKLLFAKDIPRYKAMVKQFFQEIKDKPSVSDQDLNGFLTEKVSQKFGDNLYTSSALLEIYMYASKYKDEIMSELRDMEIPADATSAQNHETPLLLKLQQVYTSMAACSRSSGDKLEVPGASKDRKKDR